MQKSDCTTKNWTVCVQCIYLPNKYIFCLSPTSSDLIVWNNTKRLYAVCYIPQLKCYNAIFIVIYQKLICRRTIYHCQYCTIFRDPSLSVWIILCVLSPWGVSFFLTTSNFLSGQNLRELMPLVGRPECRPNRRISALLCGSVSPHDYS